MKTLAQFLVALITWVAMCPPAAWGQAQPLGASDQISSIIYSDLSKSEMLEQLSPFVKVGDKLDDFHAKTGLDFFLCMGGGPGVEDCKFNNGLQLVADPDGIVQLIRRSARVIEDRKFDEMSISTNVLRWKGYARGYPE